MGLACAGALCAPLLVQAMDEPDLPLDGPSAQLTRIDVPLRSLSIPPTSAGASAQALQSARLSDVSYRWWVTRGRTDWGIGLGALALTARPLSAPIDANPVLLGSSASLTVGMRYRASAQSTVFADASGAPGFGPNAGDAYVGKLGVEWKPASLASRWNLTYGGIGWRLSSDSRMTLRVRSGGLGLYVRSQF